MLFVGRIGPILFFVIVPAVSIVITVVFFHNAISDWPNSNVFFRIFYGLFAVMTPVLYGNNRPNFMERDLKEGVEQVVDEFETLKKILIVEFPILSIVTILDLIFRIINISMGKPWSSPFGFSTFLDIMAPLAGAGMGALFMYSKSILKKEFRFYISKICFSTALTKKDIFKQMYYFNLGLQEYNNYLKRHLKHQIKDIDKIFSKVSLLDNDTKTKVICSLSESFKTENDKLKPMKYISSELMKSEDIESFLVPESLKSQLKVVGAFLSASIPIVISIITLVGKFFKFF